MHDGTAVPAELEGYRILRRVGAGGQGTVYEATPPAGSDAARAVGPGATVALKVLHPGVASDEDHRHRLRREADLARAVPAFCTARLLDAVLEGPRPFLVTEFVPGPSLAERVRAEGPLHGGELERLMVASITAVLGIHRAGIVHQDLKPANILLGPDGPRVVDFGIALRSGVAPAGADDGVLGTAAYLAPERLADDRATPAGDVFSWAATMAFAATGRSPFHAPTPDAVVDRLRTATPDLAGTLPDVRALLATCLAKNPELRPSPEVIFARLLGDRGTPSDRPQPFPRPGAGPADPHPAEPGATSTPPWGTPSTSRQAAAPSAVNRHPPGVRASPTRPVRPVRPVSPVSGSAPRAGGRGARRGRGHSGKVLVAGALVALGLLGFDADRNSHDPIPPLVPGAPPEPPSRTIAWADSPTNASGTAPEVFGAAVVSTGTGDDRLAVYYDVERGAREAARRAPGREDASDVSPDAVRGHSVGGNWTVAAELDDGLTTARISTWTVTDPAGTGSLPLTGVPDGARIGAAAVSRDGGTVAVALGTPDGESTVVVTGRRSPGGGWVPLRRAEVRADWTPRRLALDDTGERAYLTDATSTLTVIGASDVPVRPGVECEDVTPLPGRSDALCLDRTLAHLITGSGTVGRPFEVPGPTGPRHLVSAPDGRSVLVLPQVTGGPSGPGTAQDVVAPLVDLTDPARRADEVVLTGARWQAADEPVAWSDTARRLVYLTPTGIGLTAVRRP